MYDAKFFAKAAKDGTTVFIFILGIVGLFNLIKTIVVGIFHFIRTLVKIIMKLVKKNKIEMVNTYPVVTYNETCISEYDVIVPTGLKLGAILQRERLEKQDNI